MKLCSKDQSHKLLKIILGRLLGMKEKRGVKGKQWRVRSEKALCRDSQEQKENMTRIRL